MKLEPINKSIEKKVNSVIEVDTTLYIGTKKSIYELNS